MTPLTPCATMDPTHFDGLGTLEAVRACARCQARAECLAGAVKDRTVDAYRGGRAFGTRPGKPMDKVREAQYRRREARTVARANRAKRDQALREAREDFWYRLHEQGVPTAEIATKCREVKDDVDWGIAAAALRKIRSVA